MAEKILIVNVNWVGDVLFSTPFIRNLREAYPEAHIASLVHPRCAVMLEGNPRLDEIIIYDEELSHKGLAGKAALIRRLRKKAFDTAYLLHRSFTKAAIVYLAGIKERIGYPTKNRGFLLTKTAEEPDEDIHKVKHFLNLLAATGIKSKPHSCEFFIKESDRDSAKTFLKDNGIGDRDLVAVICPGGNWDPKRWPRENFAGLADILSEKFGAKVVISGAGKDIKLGEEIRSLMKDGAVIACGKTTLKELGALLERANLVIANDTGPMHIAVAMKTRVIALFGPTSPALTGPYGEGNYRVISRYDECPIPCYDFTCKDNRCMKAITVDEVAKAAEEMLKGL
jgi:heptosyltransferase-2